MQQLKEALGAVWALLKLPFTPLEQLYINVKEHMTPGERSLALRTLVPAALLLLLAGGIDFGFNGLKKALIVEHTYERDCQPGEAIPCTAQLVKLDNIFQWAASGVNGSAVFVGIFLDHFNRRKAARFGSFLWFAGFMIFALSSRMPFDSYAFGMVLSAIGGAMFFLTALEYKTEFPAISSYISSMMTITWDVASVVFVVLSAIYFSGTQSLSNILIIWACVFFFLMFLFSQIVVRDRARHDLRPALSAAAPEQQQQHAPMGKPLSDSDALQSISLDDIGSVPSDSVEEHPSLQPADAAPEAAEHKQKAAKGDGNAVSAASVAASEPLDAGEMTLFQRLVKLLFRDVWRADVLLFLVVHALSVQHCYFYMTSVLEQLLWVSGGDSDLSIYFLQVFSIMLPATGIPDGLLIGYFLQRTQKSVYIRYLLLAAGSAMWTITACIPSTNLQYLTFLIFFPWRIYSFSCIYATIEDAFWSLESSGALTGLTLTCGGLLAMINVPLLNVVINQMNGNFLTMNIVNSVIYIAACLASAWRFRENQHRYLR